MADPDKTPTVPPVIHSIEKPTRRQKAKAHIQRNKKGYTTAGILAAAVAALQLLGALGPLLCALPLFKDPNACLAATQRASEAAGKLDQLRLDDGSPMFVPAEGGGAP